MAEYDDITLRKVQMLELEILKDVISICKEFQLTYFAFAGTAIGAIRHKGFIPWDDDIDIGMPREDYEKLLDLIAERYSDKYMIGMPKYLRNFPLMNTHIIMKGTKFVTEAFKDIDCEFGIFLDVFAFDNLPDDDKKFKKQVNEVWFWAHLLMLRHTANPILPRKYRGDDKRSKQVQWTVKTIHFILVTFRISPRWIYNRCKKASCRYNNIETKRLGFCFATYGYNDWITRSKAFPTVEMDFEDIKINVPGDIDEYLRRIYGDYMQLPPPQSRKNHYPYCLDFGDK